jgi:Flp pilus assembly pilin Flp
MLNGVTNVEKIRGRSSLKPKPAASLSGKRFVFERRAWRALCGIYAETRTDPIHFGKHGFRDSLLVRLRLAANGRAHLVEVDRMWSKIAMLPLMASLAITNAAKSFVADLKDDERGLSGVVVAILLILVAVLAVVFIWGGLKEWLETMWKSVTEKAGEIQ